MTLPVKSILQRVVRELNDETSVRWTVPELVRYFNDGQRDIVSHRPDALNTRVDHPLVPGSRQRLPVWATKLIAINANATGSRGAVTLVSAGILDAQVRNWRNLPGTKEILHYVYDVREPLGFEVYPPAADGAVLDVECSGTPKDIAEPADGTTFKDVVGDFTMGDLLSNAIQNYVLFRCYRKDTEYTANPQRASAFYQAYANDLGIDIKATVEVGPTSKAAAAAGA